MSFITDLFSPPQQQMPQMVYPAYAVPGSDIEAAKQTTDSSMSEADLAELERRRRLYAASGKTTYTSPMGIFEKADINRKRLLGE